ncbi:MAG: 3'-5' exonuclease [Bdellovibrionales bacterium]|nr:3'-5' exonuclease [Bdellovibrionales bacterium]
MYLLGIDLETTGIDPSSSDIIEIGYMIWDTNLSCPVKCGSYLIKINDILPEEIKNLTGIRDNYLNEFGIELKQAIVLLSDLARKCDFLVGHNAVEFDRKYLSKACKEYSIEFPQKYWIDTMIDIPYPNSIKTRKLDYLAVEHNISVVVAHRAVFDIRTTMQILSKYDIHKIIERAKTGFIKLIAKVSYEDRAKASTQGFKWDSKNKIWFKVLRIYDAKNIQFDFPVDSEVVENQGIVGC